MRLKKEKQSIKELSLLGAYRLLPAGASGGGSQNAFPKNRYLSEDYTIHKFGCGLIALSDLLLYLTHRKGKKSGVTYEKYMDYIRYMHRHYGRWTLPYIGLPGFAMAFSFNRYARLHRLHMRSRWTVLNHKIPEKIEEMLSDGIPVIMSIGPRVHPLKERRGIHFYEARQKPGGTVYEESQRVQGHYFTVLGIRRVPAGAVAKQYTKTPEDTVVMLEIISWGRIYYVDLAEYMERCRGIGPFGYDITANILYVWRLK